MNSRKAKRDAIEKISASYQQAPRGKTAKKTIQDIISEQTDKFLGIKRKSKSEEPGNSLIVDKSLSPKTVKKHKSLDSANLSFNEVHKIIEDKISEIRGDIETNSSPSAPIDSDDDLALELSTTPSDFSQTENQLENFNEFSRGPLKASTPANLKNNSEPINENTEIIWEYSGKLPSFEQAFGRQEWEIFNNLWQPQATPSDQAEAGITRIESTIAEANLTEINTNKIVVLDLNKNKLNEPINLDLIFDQLEKEGLLENNLLVNNDQFQFVECNKNNNTVIQRNQSHQVQIDSTNQLSSGTESSCTLIPQIESHIFDKVLENIINQNICVNI